MILHCAKNVLLYSTGYCYRWHAELRAIVMTLRTMPSALVVVPFFTNFPKATFDERFFFQNATFDLHSNTYKMNIYIPADLMANN